MKAFSLVALSLLAIASNSVYANQHSIFVNDGGKQTSWAACKAVAAKLAPCLVADTANSALTTTEEAVCCESLTAFEKAGCFCLESTPSSEACAYKRRISGLIPAYERCSWRAVQCLDVSSGQVSQNLPGLLGRWSEMQQIAAEESDVEVRIATHIEPGGTISDLDLENGLLQSKIAQTLTVSLEHVSKLTAALAKISETQVEVSVEVTMDLGEGHQHFSEKPKGLLSPFWRALQRQLLVYACLAVALVAFFLLCLIRAADKPASNPMESPKAGRGIVLAAEVARLGVLGKC